jgi:hypothetical protein
MAFSKNGMAPYKAKKILFYFFYSYRRESTGLDVAAFTANHNTVRTAMSDETSLENKK